MKNLPAVDPSRGTRLIHDRAAGSVRAKRFYRIDACRAARGQIARGKGDKRQREADSGECCGISWTHAEQQ